LHDRNPLLRPSLGGRCARCGSARRIQRPDRKPGNDAGLELRSRHFLVAFPTGKPVDHFSWKRLEGPTMKTILAYGDSLTFGANPQTGGPRHAYEDRWPTVLEQGLGGKVRVIAEGLGGRTTAFDDFTADADRNGA